VVAVLAMTRTLALATLVIAAATARADVPAEPAATAIPRPRTHDDPPAKLSLPTRSDRDAWQTSGFRLGLGLEAGRLEGIRGAPSGQLVGVALHAGIRLDDDWSLDSTFVYELAKASGGLDGLRFAGTIDPTWHVTPSVSIAIGIGFGGIVEGNTGRRDPVPPPSTLDTSYTFPSARTPVASCSGVGAAGLVRGQWSHVLGPHASTQVALQAIGQYTACSDPTGTTDPDHGSAVVTRQYWPHAGATLSWGVAWR
jgi:hypothetical protein